MVEYFLNRILQRQGAAPPWVQAQIDLNTALKHFRDSIRTEWLRHVTRHISAAPGSLTTHIAAAEAYVQRDIAANYSLTECRNDWESRESKYHSLAVEDLNQKTRSYNTIAPYSARKAYTTLEKELEDCYKEVAPQIVDSIRNRPSNPPPTIRVGASVTGGALGALHNSTGQKQAFHVHEFSLMDLFRGILKRDT